MDQVVVLSQSFGIQNKTWTVDVVSMFAVCLDPMLFIISPG